MRTAELMALKWADLSNGEVTLTRTMVRGKYKEMKTKKIRDVALSKRAIEALDAVTVRTFEGHLWVNTQGEVLRDQIQLNKEWHAAIDDARVKMKPIRHRRPYNCRHTRASLGLSAGQTPGWLADQLGHDLRTFFTRYAKYMGGNNNAAELAKMGD
jgi:integrase